MAMDDVLIKAVTGLMISQQELANSTREEFDNQAAALETLAREMRASNSRISQKMDAHTNSIADTLAVLETYAHTSAETRVRVSQVEAEVGELRARVDNLEEAS